MPRSGMCRRVLLAVGLTAVAALGFGASAARAAIVNLSTDLRAEKPDIAVDAAKTAHIAWNVSVGIPGDDQLVYCRLPRGRRVCDVTHTISLPRTDFRGPQVILTRSGDVVLVSPREAFPGTRVYAVTSTDGGASFGSPHVISERFYGAGQEAALGPGDFSVSLAGGFGGGNEGVIYQAAPLDATTSAAADLTGGDWTKAFHISVGFPDPVTPLVAYSAGPSDQPSHMYFRRWDGSGDYNDVANWQAEKVVPGPGTETKLASGRRGVYLIYRSEQPPYQYFVRRYDGSNFPLSSRKVVSEPRTGESAIFRDFVEDGGGGLHAVFRQRSRRGVSGLRHRVLLAGRGRWEDVEVLAVGGAADDLFNLRVGAAADAGGAVVGDHNGKGPVWFAPFRSRAVRAVTCQPAVKLGKAIAEALEGCFRRKGNVWIATGPVKLNGVDIEPLGGGASASAAFRVVATPGKRTLSTNRKASVRVGKVVLERGPVSWRLPPGNGKVVRLGSADGSVFRDLGKFAKKLFEFPVDGDAELLIAGAGANIPVELRMPPPLGGVTGNTTLHTDQTGQVLGGMKIEVPKAAIGAGFAALRVADIDVHYDGPGRFTGKAKIQLPPKYAKAVTVTFVFQDGELSRLEIDPLIQFTPALPIIGSPPTPLVGLEKLGFVYLRKPGSRLFQGDVRLVGGPSLAGGRAADLEGTVALEFPASKPTTISASGKLKVVKIPFATGKAVYTVGLPGTLRFGGGFEIEGIEVSSVEGFVDIAKKRFSASASARVGLGTGLAVLSNKGAGACVKFIDPPGPVPALPPTGFTWKWSDATYSFPLCADLSSFQASASAARASQAGVSLPAGLEQAAIAVDGSGGAPNVTVTAPNGEQVSGGPGVVETGRFRVTPAPSASRTYVQISEPPAGSYQVEEQPGSPPIAGLSTARGLPEPNVKARVRGRGRHRALRFALKRIAGQRVTFAEQAPSVYREIGGSRKARGAIRFRPAPGPGGRRSIVAVVEQDGVPRAKLVVARYRAPRPFRPRRPRVAIRRRGGHLLVAWRRVPGARGYQVRVNLPRDGRRLLFFAKRKQHRIRVKGIERSDLGRVTVAAIGSDLRTGRPGRAKLRPKRARKRRHGARRSRGTGRRRSGRRRLG